LADSTNRIAAFGMIETHGKVNQGLQKQSAGAAFQSPRFLQHFVAAEELTVIEESDSLRQLLIHHYASVM